MNNFVFSASSLWNKCIDQILSKPTLTPIFDRKGNSLALIIPGSTSNSDLTCTVATFKKRLKNLLLACQKRGDPSEWREENFVL